MRDHEELKRLAGAIASCTSILALEERAWMRRTTGQSVVDLIDEVDELKAENEALRKDADRYRWLRRPGNTWDNHFDVNALDYWIVGAREEADNATGEDLDKSIDYFMGKEQASD